MKSVCVFVHTCVPTTVCVLSGIPYRTGIFVSFLWGKDMDFVSEHSCKSTKQILGTFTIHIMEMKADNSVFPHLHM